MITQVIWTDVNNRELDNIYARSGDEEIREIEFIICRNDPPEKVAIPAGVSGQFRMVKSSGNFVVRDMDKTVREDGTVIFKVAVSDQMVNVQGTGYYDIRLSGGGYLYTASGRFIVDTPVISTSVLEDVSEVNGLVFPDDFLTTEDHFAQIDDTIISSSSVWSSFKTNQELNNAIESVKHVYSTTEEIVGTWIDGSIIYEKTYDIGYLTSNNKAIAHVISGFGHIIQIQGYVTNNTYDFPLPYSTTDSRSCIGVTVNRTNINIYSYDRSDYHGYVTIQYTKN